MHPFTVDEINNYSQIIYAQNVERGWWDDPNRDIFQTLQLVSTEIAEATEGDRKNKDDDHLPSRKMVEVEMADTLIRLLDLAGRYGWVYTGQGKPDPLLYNADNLAAKHFAVNMRLVDLGRHIYVNGPDCSGFRFNDVAASIIDLSAQEGYDLRAAMDEKLEYNKQRADHSREARAHFDGKRY